MPASCRLSPFVIQGRAKHNYGSGPRPFPPRRDASMTSRLPSDRLPRRDILAGLASATTGLAFVNESVGTENNPATDVVDRASTIRLTGMKTYWVGPVVYVKLDTNH